MTFVTIHEGTPMTPIGCYSERVVEEPSRDSEKKFVIAYPGKQITQNMFECSTADSDMVGIVIDDQVDL